MRELLILVGSDCGLATIFIKFYHDDNNYSVSELWRTFSNYGGSDLKVAGSPRLKAHGDQILDRQESLVGEQLCLDRCSKETVDFEKINQNQCRILPPLGANT